MINSPIRSPKKNVSDELMFLNVGLTILSYSSSKYTMIKKPVIIKKMNSPTFTKAFFISSLFVSQS